MVGEDATLPPVDRIVAATGFRPDLALLGELRLDLDAAVESPRTLAPLIDPNIHSCGTVRPHGALELAHPEPDFYIADAEAGLPKAWSDDGVHPNRAGYERMRPLVQQAITQALLPR